MHLDGNFGQKFDLCENFLASLMRLLKMLNFWNYCIMGNVPQNFFFREGYLVTMVIEKNIWNIVNNFL